MQSAGQKLKRSTINKMLDQVKFIIPVVITPGTEYILDITGKTMLTEWIPRICTPKELTIFLNKQLKTIDLSKAGYIVPIQQEMKKAAVPDIVEEDSNWHFVEYIKKDAAFVSKPKSNSEAILFDIKEGINFSLTIPTSFPIKRLSQAQVYSADIRVLSKKNAEDSNDLVYKLELVSIKTLEKQRNVVEVEMPMFYQPTFKKPVTQKTIEVWNQAHPDRTTDLQIAPRTTRKCKICGKRFTRSDEELVKFLEPIYPTPEMESGMKKALIDNRVNDLFVCSYCDLEKQGTL